MSDNTDGRNWVKPPENDPPNISTLKSYAKAAKAAKGRNKIQMTHALNEYMRMKQNASNNFQGNLIEISFTKLNAKDTETPEYPSLETVGTYIFEVLKIKPTDALELDHFSSREKKRIRPDHTDISKQT